jgi:hypothetical protein
MLLAALPRKRVPGIQHRRTWWEWNLSHPTYSQSPYSIKEIGHKNVGSYWYQWSDFHEQHLRMNDSTQYYDIAVKVSHYRPRSTNHLLPHCPPCMCTSPAVALWLMGMMSGTCQYLRRGLAGQSELQHTRHKTVWIKASVCTASNSLQRQELCDVTASTDMGNGKNIKTCMGNILEVDTSKMKTHWENV